MSQGRKYSAVTWISAPRAGERWPQNKAVPDMISSHRNNTFLFRRDLLNSEIQVLCFYNLLKYVTPIDQLHFECMCVLLLFFFKTTDKYF